MQKDENQTFWQFQLLYQSSRKNHYKSEFYNNKKYIGICQCCEDRWANGNGYGYNKDMFEDIKRYGWENIEHIILLESYNNELIYQLESNLIKALK